MSTLSEQLHSQNQRRIEKFNNSHYEWLMQYEPQFTHAITLTFNPQRIRYISNKFSNSQMITKTELLELQKKSIHCFANRLNKLLFGNTTARHGNKLLLVPVIEGLFDGAKVHYHCAIGIPPDRFQVLEAKVRDAWRHAPLSGNQVDVQPYRNRGWLGYMNKQAKYINRECVDWGNVLIPCTASEFPSIAE